MIKISWIVAWLIASGFTLFGFVLCALLVGYTKKYTAIKPLMKLKVSPENLPCFRALHCPMANDVYCDECDSRQAEYIKQIKAAK